MEVYMFLKIGLILLFLHMSCSNAIDQNPQNATIASISNLQVGTPGVVKDLKATTSVLSNGKWQLKLTWTATENASTYDLKTGVSPGIYSMTYSNVKSPFVISDLDPGTTHYFVVVASGTVNGTLISVTSSEFTVTIPLDAYTEKPGSFKMTAVAGNGQVNISWENSERASFYIIQKGTSSGIYTTLVKNLAQSPYLDKDLTNGITLYYIVIAVNSQGSTNATEEASVLPLASPGSFGDVTATPGDQTVTLSWGGLSGAVSYIVKRSNSSSGPFSLIEILSSTSFSFADTSVINGSVYYYQVSCITANSATTDSTVVSVTPLALPGDFSVSSMIGNQQVQLSWTNSVGAESYTVKYGTTSGSYPLIVSDNATSPLTVNNLNNGTNYYFKIVATNPSGSRSPNELSLTPLIIPGIFSVSSTVGSQQVQLSWTDSADASSYSVAYGTSSGIYPTVVSASASSPTTITGLTNGTPYYFIVTASNMNGNTIASEISASPVGSSNYSVSVSGDDNVTILPNSTQSVTAGNTVDFQVTANNGYTLSQSVAGSCPQGNWNGSTYTTGVITQDCSVSFSASSFSAFTTCFDNYLMASCGYINSGTASGISSAASSQCQSSFPSSPSNDANFLAYYGCINTYVQNNVPNNGDGGCGYNVAGFDIDAHGRCYNCFFSSCVYGL